MRVYSFYFFYDYGEVAYVEVQSGVEQVEAFSEEVRGVQYEGDRFVQVVEFFGMGVEVQCVGESYVVQVFEYVVYMVVSGIDVGEDGVNFDFVRSYAFF